MRCTSQPHPIAEPVFSNSAMRSAFSVKSKGRQQMATINRIVATPIAFAFPYTPAVRSSGGDPSDDGLVAKNLIVVAHELTNETRAGLADGVIKGVLSHPAKQLGDTLVRQWPKLWIRTERRWSRSTFCRSRSTGPRTSSRNWRRSHRTRLKVLDVNHARAAKAHRHPGRLMALGQSFQPCCERLWYNRISFFQRFDP
ncbi:hypothetical protein EV286_103605 [Rhizobium sp. BK251]|nr:hypothetical protein EV286_103605 [Rhizobium sp. BK251]